MLARLAVMWLVQVMPASAHSCGVGDPQQALFDAAVNLRQVRRQDKVQHSGVAGGKSGAC